MDTDLFFSGERNRFAPGQEEAAKAVCAGCPVRLECAQTALLTGERFGIRGGMTPADRRRFVRQGGAAA